VQVNITRLSQSPTKPTTTNVRLPGLRSWPRRFNIARFQASVADLQLTTDRLLGAPLLSHSKCDGWELLGRRPRRRGAWVPRLSHGLQNDADSLSLVSKALAVVEGRAGVALLFRQSNTAELMFDRLSNPQFRLR
jgi:hypothetical protein